ncbi:MAG: hypothetical protein IPH35_25095 [Rhodoferax sp.]|nr:hypothetical protein [Rhodoferax sp.]
MMRNEMGRAFSPLGIFDLHTWGDAPGWYQAGPLALQYRTYASYAPTAQPHTSLGHRPRDWHPARHQRKSAQISANQRMYLPVPFERGLVRSYYLGENGAERNRAFHAEGSWLGSGVPPIPSICPFTIEAMEPTQVVKLGYRATWVFPMCRCRAFAHAWGSPTKGAKARAAA